MNNPLKVFIRRQKTISYFIKDITLIVIFLSNIIPVYSQINISNNKNLEKVKIDVPRLYEEQIDWIDYDNDGDLDLSVSGSNDNYNQSICYLIKNNNGILNEIAFSYPLSLGSKFKWIDYNNDNHIDLVAASNYGEIRIYLNDGAGNFSVNSLKLDYFSLRQCDWADYDNDGDPDFFMMGNDMNAVFRNEGNDLFVLSYSFPAIYNNKFEWGDYNKDGYKDLLMLTKDYLSGETQFCLYTNHKDGSFAKTLLNIPVDSAWYFKWYDFNNDGYQDIIASGMSPNASLRVYSNNAGSGSFVYSNIKVENLPVYNLTTGDYDNNGYPDIFLISFNKTVKLLLNSGGNSLVDADIMFPSTSFGVVSFSDYDNDMDLDMLLIDESMTAGDKLNINLYKNETNIKNHNPEVPVGLKSFKTGDKCILSWEKGSDGESFSDALSYNVRIGTQSGSGDIIVPLSFDNGVRICTDAGNALYSNTFEINKLMNGKYYWSVQTIDPAYAASSFSTEQSFDVSDQDKSEFIEVKAGILGLVNGDAAWCDYDNDGDMDVIITGYTSMSSTANKRSIIYRNDKGVFSNINASIINVTYSSIAWGDYNNDALIDFVIAGNDSSNVNKTEIYQNLGNDEFKSINAGLTGLVYPSLAWGDYDNDGDLDLIASGLTTISGQISTILYKNEGNGKFLKTDEKFNTYGKCAWADYDNDGDLDLSVGAKLFENDNGFKETNYDFVEHKSWTQFGPIIWGDYDEDGDLDILAERTLYRNDKGAFTKFKALDGLDLFGTNSSCFADFDNDGDLDILLTGKINGSYEEAIKYFRNDNNGDYKLSEINIPPINQGGLSAGDFDADGDIDILLTGNNGTDIVTKVYCNRGLIPNAYPSIPSNLFSVIGDNNVMIKWGKSTDEETLSNGLTYNVYIGTDSTLCNIKSPMSDLKTGRRYIPTIGNAGSLNEMIFNPSKSGKYYYSVQAVDNNYSASEFSPVKQFVIQNTAPSPVNLISPINDTVMEDYKVKFSWTHSIDNFSDTLAYTLKIFSTENDTIISSLKDTSYLFDGTSWIIPGIEYKWLVIANDEKYQTNSSDIFNFSKRKFDSGTIVDSMIVVITSKKDSILFSLKNGKSIVNIFWDENAVYRSKDTLKTSDTLLVAIKSNSLIPESKGGINISLLNSVVIQPITAKSIKFNYGKFIIRFYPDTSIFHLRQLPKHYALYKANETLSNYEKIYIYYDSQNINDWVDYTVQQLNKNEFFQLIALNIMEGDFSSSSYNPEIVENVLIPEHRSVTMTEGTRLYSNGLASIEVMGKLICLGTKSNPIVLENLSVVATGVQDSSFDNNVNSIYLDNVNASGVSVNNTNGIILNSELGGISAGSFSVLNVSNITAKNVFVTNSKVFMDSSNVDSSGWFNITSSILDIRNTVVNYLVSTNSVTHSYVYLKNNFIKSKELSGFFSPNKCFLVYENNKFNCYGSLMRVNNGIYLYEDNFAIINNNIITNYRNGVHVGYSNKAIIYNNTFINNDIGIDVYATPDTLNVFNNIFYNQNCAIDLVPNSYSSQKNLAYIDNNLWKELNPLWVNPYIDSRSEYSNVMGNTISYHTDPLFSDTTSYQLSANSPAIDKGIVNIPAFSFSFSILDTNYTIDDSIIIRDFKGSAPDLGAIEYDSILTNIPDEPVPLEYVLNQNYPNPFNPATRINYTIPQRALVSIEVYDILGEKVATLVNEEKPAGNYTVQFNAAGLASGVYLYQLKSGNIHFIKKMVLLR